MFHPPSAKLLHRDFANSQHSVWRDAFGNLQLCCQTWPPRNGWIIFKETLDAFIELGEENCFLILTIRFVSGFEHIDQTIDIAIAEPKEAQVVDGVEYYDFTPDDFENELIYPPSFHDHRESHYLK